MTSKSPRIMTFVGVFMIGVSEMLFAQSAEEQIAVIVHPENTVELSAKDIQRLFLGTATNFPSGLKATPIDHEEGIDIRKRFSKAVLKKNELQLKSHWSRRIFTGKGTPPKTLQSSENYNEALKNWVASHPESISYIRLDEADSRVRVVSTF